MKKLLFLLLSFMLVLTLVACGDKPSEEIGPTCVSCDNIVSKEGDVCSSCKTAGKVALYNKVIGTWNATDTELYPGDLKYDVKLKVQFTSTSILFDDVAYDFNPATGVFYPDEVPESYYREGKTFYFVVNDKYHSVILNEDGSIDICFFGEYSIENGDLAIGGSWKTYVKEGGSNNGSSSGSLDFSVEGEWLYKINGSVNTSLTINSNNTFEFVGGGATSYSGSYSLSGNKITFEFDQNASMNIKDTFTISGSEDEITLTLEKSVSTYNGQENVSTSMSSLLQIFYNIITSTSVTLSK